jgi:uncharacterized membrane protein
MRKEDNSTFAGTLMKVFSYYCSVCVFLSIAIRSLNFELPAAVAAAVSVYENARDAIFSNLPLAACFEALASFFRINLTLGGPWKDVFVILFIYTMIQVHDAKKGALNRYYASAWRLLAGLAGIVIAVFTVSLGINNPQTPVVLAIGAGVSLGMLIFRSLHPFQIGFDVGWKTLSSQGKKEPTTLWSWLVFLKDIVSNTNAQTVFLKKMTSVLKLSAWLLGIFAFYLLYRFLFPESVGPYSEFFFLILLMFTIALFQVFMESKPKDINDKQIPVPVPFSGGNKLYFSRTSGNYAIAKDICLTMLCVFVLSYSGLAQEHVLSFAESNSSTEIE